jgi:hypothetical protein
MLKGFSAMTQDPIKAIRDLAYNSNIERSMVSRFRELLPEIEQAQKKGIRLHQIVEVLIGAGFPGMSIKILQNQLYQARRIKGVKKERQLISHTPKSIDKVWTTAAVKPVNKGNGGIDAEMIMDAASKAAQGKSGSELTLALLRGNKSPINGN